jgi:hypothetical protein
MCCKNCKSYAINPHLHGRDGSKLDICDVCYWRYNAAMQGLTLVTLCDMVLGEDAPKRDDETLVQAVRALLSNAEVSDGASDKRL